MGVPENDNQTSTYLPQWTNIQVRQTHGLLLDRQTVEDKVVLIKKTLSPCGYLTELYYLASD